MGWGLYHIIIVIIGLLSQIIREPYDYICQVKGKEIRVKLIEVRMFEKRSDLLIVLCKYCIDSFPPLSLSLSLSLLMCRHLILG